MGLRGDLKVWDSIAHCQNDCDTARMLYKESLTLFRELGDQMAIIAPLRRLGYLALSDGDYEGAATLYAESLALAQEQGEESRIALSLVALAGLAVVHGQFERAATLFGTIAKLSEAHVLSMGPVDSIEHDSKLAIAREMLDVEIFTAAWTEGQAMTLEQAIAYAADKPITVY